VAPAPQRPAGQQPGQLPAPAVLVQRGGEALPHERVHLVRPRVVQELLDAVLHGDRPQRALHPLHEDHETEQDEGEQHYEKTSHSAPILPYARGPITSGTRAAPKFGAASPAVHGPGTVGPAP
jgi:hypothetical protein